jgi:hypothetical protein
MCVHRLGRAHALGALLELPATGAAAGPDDGVPKVGRCVCGRALLCARARILCVRTAVRPCQVPLCTLPLGWSHLHGPACTVPLATGGTSARSSARSYIEKDLFELHDDWVPSQYARWGFTWWRAQTLRSSWLRPHPPHPDRTRSRRHCARGRADGRRRAAPLFGGPCFVRARWTVPCRPAQSVRRAAAAARSTVRRFVMRPKPFMRQHIEMVKARIGWAAPMVRGPALCFVTV